MKKSVKQTLLERVKRFLNRKSYKEVKVEMEKELKKPEEEPERESTLGENSEENPAEDDQATANTTQESETDEFKRTSKEETYQPAEGDKTPESTPEQTASDYVGREEFDALKTEIADLKALISNLPKNSELVEPEGQQELDKLTALKNKWNS